MTGLQFVGIAVATHEVTVISTISVIVAVLPPPLDGGDVVVIAAAVEVADVAVVLADVEGATVTVTVAGGRGYRDEQ